MDDIKRLIEITKEAIDQWQNHSDALDGKPDEYGVLLLDEVKQIERRLTDRGS